MKRAYIIMVVITSMLTAKNINALAQGTSTAGASASVVAPVSIAKNFDMNFGNAAVSAMTGGTIILAPTGTRTTAGGGVTLPANTGTVAAAAFTVSGMPGYTYAISLPGAAVINGPGSATMTVNGFTSLPSGTGTLSPGGIQSLNIGATLTVTAAQVPGTYTNIGAIPVTVNYN